MTKRTRVAPATFFMLLVSLQLGISCYIIVAGPAHITAVLDNDDAYYYLQTAWNANKNDFVSFDGINKTNGFHFLWFGVLYILSFATDDKAVFLQLSRLVDALLTCVPYVVIWQLSSRLRNTRHPLFGPVMAVSWFVIVLTDRHRFLVGLESPLHATIIWLLISQYLKLCPPHGGEGLSVRDTSVFFVLLVLNTWARLDSFVVSGCFLVLFLHTHYYRRNRLQLTGDWPLAAVFRIGGAILVGGAALQFGFFWSVGDSLIPVSGLIKRYHASYLSLGAMYDWSQILFPIRVRLFNIFGILAFCLATAGLVWSSGCAANGYERAFRRSSAGLGISVLLYSFVIFGTFQN